MTELKSKRQWRWWASKTCPKGRPLPEGATKVFFCDGEAWVEVCLSEKFVNYAVDRNPGIIIDMLKRNLIQFKETR